MHNGFIFLNESVYFIIWINLSKKKKKILLSQKLQVNYLTKSFIHFKRKNFLKSSSRKEIPKLDKCKSTTLINTITQNGKKRVISP